MIIPITGKMSWRNLPVITLSLIIINAAIFFGFQRHDNEKQSQAIEYYFKSGLAEIEIHHYLIYEKKQGEPVSATDVRDLDDDALSKIFIKMRSDKSFMSDLENGRVIGINDPDYTKWKELRDTFTEKLHDTTAYRYGFIPAHVKPVSIFTYMFLHGSFGHLFGNMIFLWLVGCILEMGCGRLLYVAWYLVGGLAAIGFFWCFNMHSNTPLIGASGAISGLMGVLTILYGFKRIKVFLTLGFYFDYFKIRGIFLLPIWILNEIFSQVIYGDVSHVAYMAHAGGLMGGAALGFINLKLIGLHNENVFEEEPDDHISPLMESALHSIERLDFQQARTKLNEVLLLEPGNRTALQHLYHIEKLTPDQEAFHRITGKLLSTLCKDSDTHVNARQTFDDYMALAPKPKLSPDIFLKMISVFLNSGEADRSATMLKTLLKKRPHLNGLTAVLLKIIRIFEKNGNTEKSEYFRQILLTDYPDSHEALLIRSA